MCESMLLLQFVKHNCEVDAKAEFCLKDQQQSLNCSPLEACLFNKHLDLASILIHAGCNTSIERFWASPLSQQLLCLQHDPRHSVGDALGQPQSLLRLCRKAVHRAISTKQACPISSLPLPEPLKRYIDFSEWLKYVAEYEKRKHYFD